MSKVTNVEMKLRGFLEKFDTCEEDINKIESRYLNNDNGKAPDDDGDNDIKNLGIKIFCSTRKAGFVLCADSYEITGTRKLIAIVYDKNEKQIIEYKICDTGKYSDAHKFLNDYIECSKVDVKEQSENTLTEDIFWLKEHKIYLAETDQVLIDLDTQKTTTIINGLVKEIVENKNIKTIDGKVLSKRKEPIEDYLFCGKEVADEIAERFGCNPKYLFSIMSERGMIFTVKSNTSSERRFSIRSRCEFVKDEIGEEQLFGIKKSVIKELMGGDC